MSIKFSSSLARSYIMIADSDLISYPNADFVEGILVTLDGTSTADQYFINSGNYGAVGQLSMLMGSDVRPKLYVDNDTGTSCALPNALTQGGSFYLFTVRENDTIRMKMCPVLSTYPTDGSSVVTSATGRPISKELNPPRQLKIGERDNDRRVDNSLARYFRFHGKLTNLELAKLAFGLELKDLGKTPQLYVKMDNGDDTQNRGSVPVTTSRSTGTGVMVDGTNPSFGYSTTNSAPYFISDPALVGVPKVNASISYTLGDFLGYPYPTVTQQWYLNGSAIAGATGTEYIPTSTDTGKTLYVRQTITNANNTVFRNSPSATVEAAPIGISVGPIANEFIYQHTNNKANVAFTGGYTGTTPTSVEIKLFSYDGVTLVRDWFDAGATIVAGGTWTANPALDKNKRKYRPQFRTKNGATVLATSAISASAFGIGEVYPCIGSSSAETWFYGLTEAAAGGVQISESISEFRDSGVWEVRTNNSYISRMGGMMVNELDCCIGFVDGGVGGTGMGGNNSWANVSHDLWVNFRIKMSAATNGTFNFNGAYISLGSNDAAQASALPEATHITRMLSVIANLRDLAGRPSMPILWSGYNRRTTYSGTIENFNSNSDNVRRAEAIVTSYPNVYGVQALDYELHQDGIHLTGPGFLACTQRMAYMWIQAIKYNVYRRGPRISKIYVNSRAFIVDLILDPQVTNITPTNGMTGFVATDSTGVINITATERVSPNRLKLTVDRDVSGSAKVTYLSGGSPEIGVPVYDNGVEPMPMIMNTFPEVTTEAAPPVAPSFVTNPVVNGTPTTGVETLFTSGTVEGDAPITLTVQWLVDGVVVSTDNTYTASASQAGKSIAVRQTATNAVSSVSATSATKTLVAGAQQVVNVSKDLSAIYSIDAPAPSLVRSDLQAIYSVGSIVVTVAASRVAKFAGRKRVVKFETTDPAYRGGKWYVQKGINDELFYAGDVAKQLTEAGTTVSSVSVIATGVTAITPPTFQGSLLVVKLGGFNIASDNYVTFRVVCANGERFDRTIIFERSLDDVIFKKDPDDQLFYAADVSEMLTSGITTAVSFENIVAGVQRLSSLSVQGAVMPALIGGFDTTAGTSNYATFRVTCANGERFDKTIRFEREET